MTSTAVSAQGLGKRYRVMHQQARYGRLTESVAGFDPDSHRPAERTPA